MSKTNIEWTEESWNPIVGCSVLTPGCTNCYAMAMAARIEAGNAALAAAGKPKPAPQYDGTTRMVNGHPVWTGRIAPAPDRVLLAPLKRRKPTLYFVNSMGDLFHEDCPDAAIDRVFAVMALCPQHTFQVLTKRAARMQHYMTHTAVEDVYALACRQDESLSDRWQWPLPNVWLGISAERQQEADARIPLLLATPAAVRFVSVEPLLGPIHLGYLGWPDGEEIQRTGHNALLGTRYEAGKMVERIPKIDWVIAGGESGPRARPMLPDWPVSLQLQCDAADVAFFFKQWGSCLPCSWDGEDERGGMAYIIDEEHCAVDYDVLGKATRVVAHGREFARFGHKKTGRLLDGREHQAMPASHAGDHVLVPARSAAR